MKFLLIALVILIGGTALLVWRANAGKPVPAIPFLTERRGPPIPAAAPPAPTPPKAPTSARVIKAAASNAAPHPQTEPEDQPEKGAPSATTVPLPVPVARPPLPAPNKIALGADTEAVTGEYGDPSAWAVTE